MSKLNLLNGWGKVANYFTRRSAQSFMGANQMAFAAAGCGASDEKPSSACGAGDTEEKPSACGSACGAGDGK
ncbi:MAG: ACGX-repeat peptide [Bacteroidales bacterium]